MLLNPEFSTTWTPRRAVFPNSSKVFCRMSDNTLFQKTNYSRHNPCEYLKLVQDHQTAVAYQTYQWFCVVESFILIQFLHLWSELIGSLFPRACSRCKTKLWISSCRTAKRGWLSLAFSQRLESEATSFKNWTKDWRLYKLETLKVPVQLTRPPWWYPLPL